MSKWSQITAYVKEPDHIYHSQVKLIALSFRTNLMCRIQNRPVNNFSYKIKFLEACVRQKLLTTAGKDNFIDLNKEMLASRPHLV